MVGSLFFYVLLIFGWGLHCCRGFSLVAVCGLLLLWSWVLGCTRSSLLCGLSLVVEPGGFSLVAACGLLIVVASLVVEHGL